MKILLTGGSGFIGRALLPLLQEHDVHLISRHEFETPYATTHLYDLFESTQLLRFVYELKADCLIHLAWDTTPGSYTNSPANMEWLTQSLKLFDYFARAGGKRIIGAGTCAEYGDVDAVCKEDAPLQPSSLYAAAKASLFWMTQELAKQKKLSFAWGRVFYPYGPYEKKERLIPQLINAIGEPFEIRNYHQSKDFIHVEDVARAFAALVDSDFEGAINIGSGSGIKLGELGNMITEVAPLEGSETEFVADISKLSKIAKPRISLKEGIEKTITWRKNAAYYRY